MPDDTAGASRAPHPDLGWLGLERTGPGRFRFELTSPLSRLDGKFYGGTGIAVATAAMEAETGRAAVWCTAQFASSADTGDRLECHVEVLATGRRTSQVRTTITVGDRVVVAAVGSTADEADGPLVAQFGEMPPVPGPEDAGDYGPRLPFPLPEGRPGWLAITELREVERPGGGVALWGRMLDRPQTRATLGFLADFVPMAVVRAAGRVGGGTSLDNSIRFGPAPATDWVLVDLEPHLASGGYVHGLARLWSPDGTLLGVASQSATLRLFD